MHIHLPSRQSKGEGLLSHVPIFKCEDGQDCCLHLKPKGGADVGVACLDKLCCGASQLSTLANEFPLLKA